MSGFLSDLSNVTSAQVQKSGVKVQNSPGSQLDFDGYLKLMVSMFSNQDPDNAADTTEMMNMMVQMSSVEAIKNITEATTMLYFASLVGKEVTIGEYDKAGKLVETVGTVTGTGSFSGKPVVFVNGVSYYLSDIMAVGRLPPKEEAKTEPEKKDPPVDPTPPADKGTNTGGNDGVNGSGESSGSNNDGDSGNSGSNESSPGTENL